MVHHSASYMRNRCVTHFPSPASILWWCMCDAHMRNHCVTQLQAGVRVLQDSGDKACLALTARAIQLLQRSAPQPMDPYGPATPSGYALAFPGLCGGWSCSVSNAPVAEPQQRARQHPHITPCHSDVHHWHRKRRRAADI